MSGEFVLDDDLFSFDAVAQPIEISVDDLHDSSESDDQSDDLGEFNLEKPSES